jgi:hypothetical protein
MVSINNFFSGLACIEPLHSLRPTHSIQRHPDRSAGAITPAPRGAPGEMVTFGARGAAASLRGDGAPAAEPDRWPRPPFAHVGPLGARFGAALPAAAPPVREPRTGVDFDGEFCRAGAAPGACPRLLGVGTRQKRLAGVKTLDVYALALYVDAAGAARALGGAPGGAAALEALRAERAVEKSIVLSITSSLVNRRNFLAALEERLAPPLAAAGAAPVLAAFRAQFAAAAIGKGTRVAFTAAAGGGELATAVDGRPVGRIASHALVEAILDVYLGPKPVSPGAKAAFAAGAVRVLAAA